MKIFCESISKYGFFLFFFFCESLPKYGFSLFFSVNHFQCFMVDFFPLTFISLQKEANKFLFLNNKIIHQHCFMRYVFIEHTIKS